MGKHPTTKHSTDKVLRQRFMPTASIFQASRPFVTIVGLLLLCFLPLACTSRLASTRSSLDDQGQRKGEEYWYSVLTKCGTEYYVKDASLDMVYQFNDLSIDTTPSSQLTEASRQNGVEWRGVARVRSKTSRMRIGDHEWDTWRDGSILPNGGVTVERVKGIWLFEGKEKPTPSLRAVDCSKVE
jgi:hypothetical protein